MNDLHPQLIDHPELQEKPAWLDLPEKSEYWACTGTDLNHTKTSRTWFGKKISKKALYWRYLFYTQEDAEAHACVPNNDWRWDGLPAEKRSLAQAMHKARRRGDLGVRVLSYQDGGWRVVKEYPADVPLPLEEREQGGKTIMSRELFFVLLGLGLFILGCVLYAWQDDDEFLGCAGCLCLTGLISLLFALVIFGLGLPPSSRQHQSITTNEVQK